MAKRKWQWTIGGVYQVRGESAVFNEVHDLGSGRTVEMAVFDKHVRNGVSYLSHFNEATVFLRPGDTFSVLDFRADHRFHAQQTRVSAAILVVGKRGPCWIISPDDGRDHHHPMRHVDLVQAL